MMSSKIEAFLISKEFDELLDTHVAISGEDRKWLEAQLILSFRSERMYFKNGQMRINFDIPLQTPSEDR